MKMSTVKVCELLCVLVLSSCALVLSSCAHKDLYRRDSRSYQVMVSYDWSEVYGHELPSAMRIMFYPTSDPVRTEAYTYDFSGNEGGTVSLPAGDYDVVSYNHDTDNILVDGTDAPLSLRASTQLISSRSRAVNIPDSLRPAGTDIYDSPSWFTRAYRTEVTVLPDEESIATRVGESGGTAVIPQSVALVPEWSVYLLEFRVEGIKGISFVSHAEGLLTGLSDGLDIAYNTPVSEGCAMPLELTVDVENQILTGNMYIWGLHGNSQVFTLAIWASDRSWYGTFDISDQLAAINDTHGHDDVTEVDITLTVDVEFTSGQSGGFVPSVEDYENVDIPVPIL